MAKTKVDKTTKKSQKESVKKANTIKSKPSKNGKKTKSPLKRSTLGFEVEFFILDKNGKMVNECQTLLKKIEEKKRDPGANIVKESHQNMIEVNGYPGLKVTNTLPSLISNIRLLLYTAEELDLVLCPLAVYPGKHSQKTSPGLHYKSFEKLYGKKRFDLSARTVGFHFHYELPWGVFDAKKKMLKRMVNSKNMQSVVNVYNFLTATDPAISAFLQSSPFYQGQNLAKDCRKLIIEGGEDEDGLYFPDSLYAKNQEFGALPEYIHTSADLVNLIEKLYKKRMDDFKKLKLSKKAIPNYKSKLDTNWQPVRINKHGTTEARGMDMNHLQVIFAVSILLSRILRAIQEKYINVECSDIAISEPFKFEKNTIYIPPHSYVKEMERKSVYKGFESEDVWYYCKRLLWLVKMIEGKKVEGLLDPLEKMIKNKKTVADEIIKQAQKLGHKDLKKELPADIAAEIALDHSKRLFKEIVIVEKMIDELA